ncbi:MAG: metal-sulfur cluster assembly factor [Spirochaetales bacterium]|nr:metal-sulfur cluster assembly factor [Spirochaetales bacterium]
MKTEELSIEKIMRELHRVIDPEYGYSIVDLGLIYGVEVDEKQVSIEFTLTHEGCPYGPMIEDSIFFVLKDLTDKTIFPRLVWEPAWDPLLMSDEIKLEMGFPV